MLGDPFVLLRWPFHSELSFHSSLIYHDLINENNLFVEYKPGSADSSKSADELLAPVLGAKKNGTATAKSSRGLLLTLLGEFVLSNGGSAWTQTIVEGLGMHGVEEKAARQAISRLAERDWLRKDKVGRRTRWTLSPELQGLLEDGAARIYGFGLEAPAWNGEWLLLSASLPERDRKVRYQLASGLNWAGFGSLGQGWWISTRPEREAEAMRVLAETGVKNVHSFTATHGTMGDPLQLAERAWDLSLVRSQYEQFLRQADELATSSESQHAHALIQLLHSWRRFPFLDPDLPPALLPADWPGHQAALRYHELNQRWSSSAHRWWNQSEELLSK